MKLFAGSIMCADQMNVEEEVKKVEASDCTLWHCDVMDGVYVNNLALFPEWLAALKKITVLPLDIHLATVTPEKYINMFAPIEPKNITFHIETTDNAEELIDLIHSKGIKAGIALNPETPLEIVYPYLESIDLLLVMTVNPGFAGQAIQPETIEKVKKIRKHLLNIENPPLIQVDGNINFETIEAMDNAADIYVLGTSALFHNKDHTTYYERVARLKGAGGK
ncbi:ribulose-phosphate 3-epimerase [Vagococcus acidifermentans]|uniref:Ribulose phosphate epimerase n=1 Tax=Vagococcus acidifermentans TaxID=564710 RepID=A0A430B2Y4_9ENTE|nr:ribulose-phosphate 3-epimerase [Vagococcus acidifermentans]RSU14674.1 ribulose phosphate epimerase [Vagococcus acidifermentans]